jgi:hypothetical protein
MKLTLGGFYFVIVFFGVSLLATVQLRSSGASAFDTWLLNYNANRALEEDLRKQIDAARQKARQNANDVHLRETCLRLFDKNGLLAKNLVDDELAAQVAEAKKKATPLKDLFGDLYCVVRGYSDLETDLVYFKADAAETISDLDDLKKQLTMNENERADLIKGHQEFLAYREMAKSWYQKPFVIAPYDLLVLLLVMSMGSLGGIVRLLRDYGAADIPSPNREEYFLIPLIGTVVAIGGYVLAKTGLLLLSSAREESSLSPFMISLVGIVSGLLAKEVIDVISARGRKMLSGIDGATKAVRESEKGTTIVAHEGARPRQDANVSS